jgi:hypothetical protein
VPDFRKNVLTMPVLVDRAHTLDITAYIPEGQPRPGVRPRASKDLAPLVIPPGRSDERIAVVAPFSNCDDRP